MTASTLAPAVACPSWCSLHDPESDMCYGSSITLDLGRDMGEARIVLIRDPQDGVSVSLFLDRQGSGDMSAAAARVLAHALNAAADMAGGAR